MLTFIFWKAASERAVKTFAQTILALLGTGSVGITTLDWWGILSVAATATLASVLTSLASLSTVTDTTARDTPGGPQPKASSVVVNAPATAVDVPAATMFNIHEAADPLAAAKAVSFAATQAKIDALPAVPPTDYVPLDKPAIDSVVVPPVA